MTRWVPIAGVALVSALLASLGTVALTSRSDGGDVRAYLLKNPEVLQEAMDALRLKQAAAQIAPHRDRIETPYAGAWIGAKDGDVTLVQFFDYACGYCRASLPDVERLVREDPRVKIVFRELPILSRESEVAAPRLARAEHDHPGGPHGPARPGEAAGGDEHAPRRTGTHKQHRTRPRARLHRHPELGCRQPAIERRRRLRSAETRGGAGAGGTDVNSPP
jgi:thiol-disulfide isomerase/thioredoxin